jgi:Phage tail tube protein, GTA-gp10
MKIANHMRGEIQLQDWVLRPSFENLVAAEAEIGSLFALIEAAGAGKILFSQMMALLWHCIDDRHALTRAEFEADMMRRGIAQITPVFRSLLEMILAGA